MYIYIYLHGTGSQPVPRGLGLPLHAQPLPRDAEPGRRGVGSQRSEACFNSKGGFGCYRVHREGFGFIGFIEFVGFRVWGL